MDRHKIDEAFTILKPFCDYLLKYPSVDSVYNVANTLTTISDKVLEDLFRYIIFPFDFHLSNDKLSKNIKEELVKTIQVLISKTKVSKFEDFRELYSKVLIQIYDQNRECMVIEGHEELKEAVLSCIKVLINSCFVEVIESLYTKQNAPKIGQGLLLATRMVKYEKSCSLRIKAIEAIMALCRVDDETDKSDIVLQSQVADTIMLFLPGILNALLEVATGSNTQGHKLTMIALRAWTRIVCLVMQDKTNEEDSPTLDKLIEMNTEATDSIPNPKDDKNLEKHITSETRNEEYFKACAIKLNVHILELGVLREHSNYMVRKELVEAIHLLLTSCSRNMKLSITLLIKYLISLSEDEFTQVSDEADRTLNLININYMRDKNMRFLVELLEENFYDSLTELPGIIRRSDDSGQLSCLNQIAGHIKLLGKERLPSFMMSAPHIRRLILALVYISEIDCTNISLLQTVNIKDIEDPAYTQNSCLWRQLKFIQSDACEAKIITICKYLAEFGDLRVLVDTIFSLAFSALQHTKELILLLNWILNVPIRDTSNLTMYKEIVEFYTSTELWYPTIETNEDTPLRVAQSNVVQCCLLLEGLGLIAQTMKHHYDKFLLKTLYLIVERAGSRHSLISFVGTQTLERIAESQGHNTVGDLLRANFDYLSYRVSMKLRRAEYNHGVLDVVTVIIKYGSMKMLPCLKDMVEDALIQLNSSLQRKNSYAFLKLFYAFTICIKNITCSKCASTIREGNSNTENKHSQIIKSLLEYCEAKKIDDEIDNIEEENDEIPDVLEQEEEKKEVPSHIKMVENVMKCCLHFLPSKEIEKSLIAMTTLQEGVEILADWEEQLLPLVHLLWHPLVDRFNNKNALVINHAWQLLVVLSRVSKDFIRLKVLKQVLPSLSKFLLDSSKESYKTSSNNVYKFTQIYKLQKELLLTLGEVTKNLWLREQETWNVLSIAEPYLDKHQNPMLQECCIQLYKKIADYNSDIVWVKCLSIFNSKVTNIPPNTTLKIQDLMNIENISRDNYLKNLQIIIKYIEDKDSDC